MLIFNKTVILFLIFFIAMSNILAETENKGIETMLENIKWLGHASVLIKGQKIIYIDPWQIKDDAPKADLILITHEHYDHCSVSDVAKIQKPETVIVTTTDCASKLKGRITIAKPNEALEILGIKIETVPAYNLAKSFHPKKNNWLGYIVTVDGKRLYHTGDSDFIPEMRNIKTDIIFAPVGGTYTMDSIEAAKMVNTIKPALAIPIHFGRIVGSLQDAQTFQEQAQVKVIILESGDDENEE